MPNTDNIEKMFPWLTRVGIGRRFPGMPIGWYQTHQMCAIRNIEHRAKKALATRWPEVGHKMIYELGPSGYVGGYEVRASGGEVFARPGGARMRFVRIGTVRELFKNADDCTRGDKQAEFRGARRRR